MSLRNSTSFGLCLPWSYSLTGTFNKFRAHDGSRTHTEPGLSQFPLPIGIREQTRVSHSATPAHPNPLGLGLFVTRPRRPHQFLIQTPTQTHPLQQ